MDHGDSKGNGHRSADRFAEKTLQKELKDCNSFNAGLTGKRKAMIGKGRKNREDVENKKEHPQSCRRTVDVPFIELLYQIFLSGRQGEAL